MRDGPRGILQKCVQGGARRRCGDECPAAAKRGFAVPNEADIVL
ncbi:hypothetical protein PAMC26510_35050 [Caballeronia sordidicola]|uniref:Uncharacterized protein n=1 Tax=Caballeronia sordidicola TaxID=196367 RepID=A0A242M696_CABSO|nr:hypothetical protein PAMC26510_35050 [Caballeronia sordidicola]